MKILDQLGGSRSDLPGGGEVRFRDPLGGSRSDLPGGGKSEICDLFSGDRSVLPGGGTVKSLICSVATDRTYPVVAQRSS